MMGRREVGCVRDLSGQKVTTSPISHYPTPVFHYPTPVFPLSYALKNHKKAKLICTIQRKAVSLPAVDTWGVHIYLVAL